jgi:hypothetical protein
LLVALAPLFYLFSNRDSILVQAMAFVILSVYWFLQWLIMKAAVISANHELPDEMLGSYSNREIISAKLWAVLRHYQGFILLVSLAALGLSLALMGYFSRISTYTNLSFMGYIGYFGSTSLTLESFSLMLPHPFQIIIGFLIYFGLSVSNSILTSSFAMLYRRIGSASVIRLVLIVLLGSAFLTFFFIREHWFNFRYLDSITARECNYDTAFREEQVCDKALQNLFLIRIIDNLQSASFAFIDGGITLVSTLLCPGNNYNYEDWSNWSNFLPDVFAKSFYMIPFEWRQIGVAVVTVLGQFSLSVFLLWRASRGMGKKKK